MKRMMQQEVLYLMVVGMLSDEEMEMAGRVDKDNV